MEKFTVTPKGINHNEKPSFTAHWLSGAEAPEDKTAAFYYKGSGGNDSLLIYGIVWADEEPGQEKINRLMDEAISALDNWISERF